MDLKMSSTKLTKKIDAKPQMVASKSLKLASMLSSLNDTIVSHVSQELIEQGYQFVTPSLLNFLSILDCGVNYSAEVARRLGVSRQMVSKTVKEMSELGLLELVDDPNLGNQKVIIFTSQGENLISKARQILLEMDNRLEKVLGKQSINDLIANLDKIQNNLSKLP